jgi:capsular exopolysaccharide synthesis family protein
MGNPYQADYLAALQAINKRKEELTPLLEHQLKRELAGVDDNGSATTMQVLQGQIQLKRKQLEALDEEYKLQLEKVTNITGFSSDLIARKQDWQSLQESNHEMSREIARLEIELMNENRIQRVQPATIPNAGSYLLKMIEVVGGGFLTLVGVVLGIALWDYKSKRLNTSKDVESTCRLPVIGTMPSLRHSVGGLLGSRGTSESVIGDSIDSVRAAIMYSDPSREIKSVLITSAVGHEGKSTVASQLAVSLARSGRRTLLVDADIRNPQQHAVFGLPLDRGLCDVVRGQAELEEVIQATPAEGLWILPAGRFDGSVMQAFSGPVLAQTMERLADQFDFVILDSGPVLTGPVAIICGQYVDAAVISTRRDVSRLPKVEEAYRRLQSVGVYVIGSVVNGTKTDVRVNQIALTPAHN